MKEWALKSTETTMDLKVVKLEPWMKTVSAVVATSLLLVVDVGLAEFVTEPRTSKMVIQS